MRRMSIALRGALLSTLLLALGSALPGLSPAAQARPDEAVEITIAEEPVDMEDFLRVVARTTGKQLIWNPQDKNIRGKKIIGGLVLKGSKEDFLGLVRSVLTFYELVMIPVGPSGSDVILIADARQTSSILKLKPTHVKLTPENLAHYESQDGLFITTTITIEHMEDLRNARNALTRIVTGQNIGNVTEVPSANAFVVTDFAPNVCAIYRLLREMDVPSATTSTTSGRTVALSLEHAEADSLARTLTQHFATIRVPQQNPRAPQIPAPRAPRITPEPRTNKILVTGNDEQIAKVKEVLTMLDVPVPMANNAVHYVRLKHIDSDRTANTLSDFILGSPTLFEGHGDAAPAVVSHREKNALLVSASRRDFEQLARLISEMDQEDPAKK